MRIKFYFSILVLFLLGLGGALLYLAKGMQILHLYIVEGIIACILVFLVVFYRKIVKPMNIIGSGMELLREQDFSSRLSKVGQYEAVHFVMSSKPNYKRATSLDARPASLSTQGKTMLYQKP